MVGEVTHDAPTSELQAQTRSSRRTHIHIARTGLLRFSHGILSPCAAPSPLVREEPPPTATVVHQSTPVMSKSLVAQVVASTTAYTQGAAAPVRIRHSSCRMRILACRDPFLELDSGTEGSISSPESESSRSLSPSGKLARPDI